jgi:hypothetical protein
MTDFRKEISNMEKKFIDYLIEHAKQEFECANFHHTPLSHSMLNFLEESAEFTNNDPSLMKELVNILNLLIDKMPIVPITEDDFEEFIYREENRVEYRIWKCKRYEHVYKTEDGKYWDDRAISFRKANSHPLDKFYLYQSNMSSKQEIKLPYYPKEQVIVLDD